MIRQSRSMLGRSSLAALVALFVLVAAGRAEAQRASLVVEADEVNAGAPFVLALTADDFDENPTPTVEPFTVPGATVTPLGVSPQVSTSVTIINGRRTDRRQVRYVFRFQIVAARAGTLRVPTIEVTQGTRRATAEAGQLEVHAIDATDDMALRVTLPERTVSVGETFDATIDWYLSKDPDDPSFTIPLFDLSGIEVSAPPPGVDKARTLTFQIAGRPLELPYRRDEAALDGRTYTRFRFVARVTPLQPGRFELAPAQVVARLPVGYGRDQFGFRTAQSETFKAVDVPRVLEVAALPTAGRPPSFSGAVGSGFAVEVHASHTVVHVGDPLELTIVVRGKGHLEGLGLPRLDGPGGLPPADFDTPDGAPAGELIEEGKAKRFSVTARIQRPVSQIPPLELGYWNPETWTYEVARSQAIALSVGGASVVGAGQVVGSPPAPVAAAAKHAGVTTSVGADLSPSPPERTRRRALTMDAVRPLVAALYAVPSLLFLAAIALRRSRGVLAKAAGGRRAGRELDAVLERVGVTPAREIGAPLGAALRELGRASGRPPADADALIARIQDRAFDPHGAGAPLPVELVEAIRAASARWQREREREAPGRRGAPPAAPLAILIALIGAASLPPEASAERSSTARTAYQAALETKDATARPLAFAHAEEQYRDEVAGCPACPELLTDWGNAALGAGHAGTAALAYRRALALAPGLERARKNLAWLRAQQPTWASPDKEGALDSLLFWHRRLTHAQKHAWAAACFALALLLVTPLGSRGRGRRRRRVAIVPALAFVAIVGSLAFDPPAERDAVVIADDVVLRAADSAGAPAAVADPVPAGAEAVVLERRGEWQRVTVGGATGWFPSAALARVDGG